MVLRGGEGSLQFAAFVYEEDRHGNALTLDELIVLNALFFERRIDSVTAGKLIQKGQAKPGPSSSGCGSVAWSARGEKRRTGLSVLRRLYRRMNQPEGHLRVRRDRGDPPRGDGARVRQATGKIVRGSGRRVSAPLTNDQATRLLKRMVEKQWLPRKEGPPRWVFYVLGPKAPPYRSRVCILRSAMLIGSAYRIAYRCV